MTKIEKKMGNGNYKAALACCMACPVVSWAGCCLLPLCMSSFNDHIHKCYKCGEVIHVVNGGDKIKFVPNRKMRKAGLKFRI